MKKRLMAMLLISVLVFSCVSISTAAVERPVVTIDKLQFPADYSTSTVITVPVRTSAFTNTVQTVGLYVTFDNTKLQFVKNCPDGNIPANDDMVPVWDKLGTALEQTTNDTGLIILTYQDGTGGESSYISSNIIPGEQDILKNLTFKRKAGAEGEAFINIQNIIYSDTTFVSSFSYQKGDIDVVNGSITFSTPETATPEPVVTATPEPDLDHDITVSIDNTKGYVLNMATGKAVLDGQKVSVADGAAAQFKAVAYGGYKISDITYGGTSLGGGGMFKNLVNIGAVTSDATLAVTFEGFDPGDPQIDSYDKVFVDTESGQPMAVSYGTVHGDLGVGVCGIILWDAEAITADPLTITLEVALADQSGNIQVFSATTGAAAQGISSFGQFGIKVRELGSGHYKMKTYVVKGGIVNYGDVVSFDIAA